jgi:sugar phosphate isomerase/epimerase
MRPFPLGVRLESLGLPFRPALEQAARLGAAGVQFDAVGDLSPDALSQSGRKSLLALLRTLNLQLTAIGCPLRHTLDVAENQQPRLEHVRKVMTLAYELGPHLVVLTAGQVPEKEDTPDARRLRESLTDLHRHGDRVGTTLALETGLESGPALAAYLATFDTGCLGANLDPANLLLRGFDPLEAVAALRERIALIHARDCRKGGVSRAAREVPLGAGDIDWLALVEALREAEYRGWLVVEREEGNNRLADVTAGVAFLRRLAGP